MALSGKRSNVAHERASSGSEEVTQAPTTLNIKMIINTKV